MRPPNGESTRGELGEGGITSLIAGDCAVDARFERGEWERFMRRHAGPDLVGWRR